jgi:hypothetical protein
MLVSAGALCAPATSRLEETIMLKTIAAILVVFWLLGFMLHVAGSLIHLLLAVAVVVLLVDLLSGRHPVV